MTNARQYLNETDRKESMAYAVLGHPERVAQIRTLDELAAYEEAVNDFDFSTSTKFDELAGLAILEALEARKTELSQNMDEKAVADYMNRLNASVNTKPKEPETLELTDAR